jgi:predicted metal-dependent peptidase
MGQGRGSVLERAISEAEGILKCCKVNVRIIDCDAAVYGKAQAVKSMKQADLHGGGGTNMVTGILAALNSKPRPDMIVLITDGGTNWPTIQQLQGVKMVTCIIGGGLGDCPPFMNPILVDD